MLLGDKSVAHTWAPDHHNEVRNGRNASKCNSLVAENGTVSKVTQALFCRAFYYYNVIDLFGQVPLQKQVSKMMNQKYGLEPRPLISYSVN
jgi:hypothetical protein